VVIAGIVALWSLFTLATGLAWGFVSLLLFRFMFGAAEAGAYPSVARTFYSWLPTGERGLAQGINFSGSRLGAAFALPVVAWLVTSVGWRTAFVILGGIGILWAGGWYAWFRNTPEEHPGVTAPERAFIEAGREAERASDAGALPLRLGDLGRSRNMWLVMGQYFASNFTFFFCLTWLFPYLQRTYDLGAVQAGFFASAPLVAGAIGNWVGGAMVDSIYRSGRLRMSRQLPAMLGFSLAAIGLLGSLQFDDPVFAVLFLSIAIFGADMTLPPSWAFCIDIGRSHAGAVSGTMNMAGNLGSFVTSLAFPYLLVITGSTNLFFLVGAALNILAVLLWWQTDATRPITPTGVASPLVAAT
jgi:ACS family glucarate transporter-like MFS transporter